MTKEYLIMRSTITAQLMKNFLFKGFAIALLGACILIFAALFLEASILQKWGGILFLMSIGLITLGLLPYRHLCRLQLNPNEIVLVDTHHIAFYLKKKKVLTLPLQAIANIKYIDHPTSYGIAITLKQTPAKPIIIHQLSKEANQLRRQGELLESDLFFPYFNRHAYHELLDWQNEESFKIDDY